jgi:hypothetical protein
MKTRPNRTKPMPMPVPKRNPVVRELIANPKRNAGKHKKPTRPKEPNNVIQD